MTLLQKIRKKLKREGKYLRRDIGHVLGMYKNFYRSARGARILIYHGICRRDHTRFNPIFLKVQTLEAHLKFYKKYFNIVSLDDYYEGKLSNDKFNVCLTFDDGFANNHKYVLPLLTKYQAPATFFITAIRDEGYDILWNDFLSIAGKYGPEKIVYEGEPYRKGQFNRYISAISGISLNEKLRSCDFREKAEMMNLLYPLAPFKTKKADEDYWLQMTKEQIAELASSPFAGIGAHGYYHNDLTSLSIFNAAKELSLSKQYLEGIIKKTVRSFAFPYGAYNADVVEAAKKAEFTQLLAMDFLSPADVNDPVMRERFTVNPFISVNNQMYAIIMRSYD